MKKLVVLLLAAMSLSSCLTLEGRLEVTESMTVKRKSGLFGLGSKKVTINPAVYQAKFDVVDRDSFVLQLVRDGEKDIRIPLKSERSLNVPHGTGNIFISHSDLNVDYDIAGFIQTDVDTYGHARDRESCSWTTVERRCRPVCRREPNGSQHCDKVCEDITVTHHGYKQVQYHYERTFRALDLEFLKGGSNVRVANFKGTDTKVNKIYDYQGPCF